MRREHTFSKFLRSPFSSHFYSVFYFVTVFVVVSVNVRFYVRIRRLLSVLELESGQIVFDGEYKNKHTPCATCEMDGRA